MPRTVKCAKLGQELPGMVYKPFNNDLGQRIYDSVSQEA
jgi:Fe-S cluster biosynthesis and repair protein YggX